MFHVTGISSGISPEILLGNLSKAPAKFFPGYSSGLLPGILLEITLDFFKSFLKGLLQESLKELISQKKNLFRKEFPGGPSVYNSRGIFVLFDEIPEGIHG